MTPSNTHSGTVARRLRRAFLLTTASGLLVTFMAAPAPVFAQETEIQFSVGSSSFTRYRVADDGTGLQSFAFPATSTVRINASTRRDYPGGRKYLYQSNKNLMAWSEDSGQSKAITNFPSSSPGVYPGGGVWSNDGLDSFVTFSSVNGTKGWTYRAHVSAADIASPSYQPISSVADPRLELVCNFALIFYSWSHDGTRLYYKDDRSNQSKVLRVKTVGVGVTPDDDPIVFIAPSTLGEFRVIPPVDPFTPDSYVVASSANGILAIDLATSTWWSLATGNGSSTGPRGPVFSPDGSMIAFGNTRTDSKGSPYYGVYVVPFFGGPTIRVTEVKGSKLSVYYPTVNNWNFP